MTNSSPWYRWPIEIDGLPNLKMVNRSMAMLNNQMVKHLVISCDSKNKTMKKTWKK